ncbi:uncharacterized protein DFL_001226 [Arthrobotrys flagrans]|uniref:Low temperature viability protein n=1 Tax=Arthrobotrys flagrans TaxID=97331 RepID=A0A437AGJ1_ARTFL|nr:hypothetical protein DFL_001226 [Arthrobotrys flagrans]
MPKKRWIDKKSAQTFTLVHRSQQDPLIHDAEASQMVFKEIATPNVPLQPVPPSSSQPSSSRSRSSNFSSASSTISTGSRIKNISDLESEYGFKSRANEGEAALYGIYYDDTEYDYMQHMRDIGVSSEAVFIPAEAPSKQKNKKGKAPVIPGEDEEEFNEKHKGKKTLEELLEEDTNAKNGGQTKRVQLPAEVLPSGGVLKRSYQDQQDVPDVIAGFKPDLDPRLREVLEALEDEAYVESEEEDFFTEIAKSGQVEEFEFERSADFFDDDEEGDDGWESDVTEKAYQISSTNAARREVEVGDLPDPEMVGADETAIGAAEDNEDWQKEFAKFKKDKKKPAFRGEGLSSIGGKTTSTAMSFGADDLASLVSSFNNRKLKKKGVPSSARSMTSSYSMSSSALFRTEGLTTLDDRFDRIEEEYARDEEEDDMVSQSSVLSSAPERQDFNNILDEFLDSYSTTGKRNQRVRRGKQQSGMEQLDDIRKGLGKPRLASKS